MLRRVWGPQRLQWRWPDLNRTNKTDVWKLPTRIFKGRLLARNSTAVSVFWRLLVGFFIHQTSAWVTETFYSRNNRGKIDFCHRTNLLWSDEKKYVCKHLSQLYKIKTAGQTSVLEMCMSHIDNDSYLHIKNWTFPQTDTAKKCKIVRDQMEKFQGEVKLCSVNQQINESIQLDCDVSCPRVLPLPSHSLQSIRKTPRLSATQSDDTSWTQQTANCDRQLCSEPNESHSSCFKRFVWALSGI